MIRELLRKILKREKKPAARPAEPPKDAKLEGNVAADKDRPWYLDGKSDVEGWDSTNVKKD